MSKYKKLWEYISKNNIRIITFTEVNTILGFPIDHSFLNHKNELNEYGYNIDKIFLKEKKILISKLEV